VLSWYLRAAVQGLVEAAVNIGKHHVSEGRLIEAETWFARITLKNFGSGGWMESVAQELSATLTEATENSGKTSLVSGIPSTHRHKRHKIS